MPTEYGITDNGFIFPTRSQIREDMEENIRSFIPQLSFRENSPESAFVGFNTEVVFDMYQVAYDVYNSQNIEFANGCRLDNLGASFGVYRLINENDESYRARIKQIQTGSGALSGQFAFDRIYNDIISIDGVSDVQINVNQESKYVNGLPPNSYEVMVIGGDNDDIAQSIWRSNPPGITAFGSDTVQITDDSGVCRSVSFTRPFFVPIYVDIRVERTSSQCACPTSDTSVIVDAVSNYLESDRGVCFTRIGQPVNVQDLFYPIFQLQGMGVSCALLGRDGEKASQEVISLGRNEVPYFDKNCINIEFTDKANTPCITGQYSQPEAGCGFTLDLEVTTRKNSFVNVGEIINLTYKITNNSQISIPGPILVSDSRTSVNCPDLASGGLGPGQSITCTGSYPATYEDAFQGRATNRAQAFSGDNFSKTVLKNVSYSGPPLSHGMEITSTLFSGSCNAVGDVIEFRYLVKNTGNVPLDRQIAITDSLIGKVNTPSIPQNGLLPNQSISARAKTVVTQEQLDNGEICRRVSALSGTVLGSLAVTKDVNCVSCAGGAGGGANNAPIPPKNVIISNCDTAFPYTTLAWSDDSGSVSLSANGTDTPRGLTLTDNGNNTATIALTGTFSNGNVTITGTDNEGATSTQIITINCRQTGSAPQPPANIAVSNCSQDNFPINTGYWLTDDGPLTLTSSGEDRTNIRFIDNGDNSGTIQLIGSRAFTGFMTITGTDRSGRSRTQNVSFSCTSGGTGDDRPNTIDEETDLPE